MILRIVRMEFEPAKLATFLTVFDASKHQIRAFEGCHRLELHTDAALPNVRYTYSVWESESALNAYRESALFQSTWAATKVLFCAKPQAFSLVLSEIVDISTASIPPQTAN